MFLKDRNSCLKRIKDKNKSEKNKDVGKQNYNIKDSFSRNLEDSMKNSREENKLKEEQNSPTKNI